MPKMSTMITVDARICITYHHLRNSKVPELLKDAYDFAAPGGFLEGTVISVSNDTNGKVICEVQLDDLQDHTFFFLGTKLKYLGPARSRIPPVPAVEPITAHDEETSTASDSEEEVIDISSSSNNNSGWVMGPVTVDTRNISPSHVSSTSVFNLPNKSNASPADYFFFFLPMDYIRKVVIPNINTHAASIITNWSNVTFLEYTTWMALLMTMTVMAYADKKAYWHKGSNPLFYPKINFSDYMDYERFFLILKHHVFELYDPVRNLSDPLYQIRGILAAFNNTLAEALVPGKYLCIDESMNQWLGAGMPNIKKVPRKPHPIGQEFKTLADNDTFCILQLDTVSDKVHKEFDDVDRKLVATVKRLCKPRFASGRTIIADSWFESPEMTIKLLDQGLFSIMQVTKRAYWPKGMPSTDMIQCLRPERGSSASMSKVDDSGRSIFVCSYRDKKAKVLISSCSTTKPSSKSYQDSNGSVLRRPQVFEDYESQKSSVDTNNNRRDNMISFHDVMKTYRWEVRFLSFMFGIAEANAFSCYKKWGNNGEGLLHAEFKSRLALSLLHKVKNTEQLSDEEPASNIVLTRSRSDIESAHKYVSISNTGPPKRLICRSCKKNGVKPVPRVSKRCFCDITPMCKSCHLRHFIEESNKIKST